MVFSSSAFVFFFLPITLILYYLVYKKRTASNAVLCVMSLLFYAWGEPKYVLIMLGSIVINWVAALLIENHRAHAKPILAVGVIINILILGVFKYTGFAIRNINSLFAVKIIDPKIALPIGISFFTFQAMSYIIDVYRGRGKAQKHLMGVCLYISFFPQLIAGPIVRYETVAQELTGRKENFEDFSEGIRRFIIGFSKKAILANALGSLTDMIFALSAGESSVVLGWVGACAYLMQVYYDFSGYSDMAIGLGRVFGFHFLENFTYPFVAKSITEFWRRWHISMGTWFKDYVFIPLGGSRVKRKSRAYFNMFAVWALTGLWHGADWTFVCWGVSFFILLALEKTTGFAKWAEKHFIGHFYAMILVVVVTVLIRSDSISAAFAFYRTLFGGAKLWNPLTGVLLRENTVCLVAACLFSMPLGSWLKNKLRVNDNAAELIGGAFTLAAGFIAVTYVVSGGYNPFIYFNF